MWVDSHCHLDFPEFDADRDAVIARAKQAKVCGIVLPAVTAEHWPRVARMQARYGVMPAYGLHPLFQDKHRDEHLQALDTWLDKHDAVAVGECGLDFYRHDHDAEAQRVSFDAQLAIAHRRGLPVIVHLRKAMDEALSMIKRYPGVRGILHSFSGSDVQAQRALDLGFKLGVGGPVTYERAQRLRHQVKQLPENAWVLETDAPDQPLSGRQGQRNEPARVSRVGETVAQLRNQSLEQCARSSRDALHELFPLAELS